MWLAYFDESGDSGHPAVVKSPTNYFVLSGVLVHHDNWLATLDRLITLRRHLRVTYGISTRPEIKAQDIRPCKGVFRGLTLSHPQRLDLYRELMRYQESSLPEVRCFSVAIAKIIKRDMDIRETAWIYALERIDTFCQDTGDKAIIFPDVRARDVHPSIAPAASATSPSSGLFRGEDTELCDATNHRGPERPAIARFLPGATR